MFEIKLPEHALGNFFAQKAAAEVYTQYAEILGEEKAQEAFSRTWRDLDEVERLESLGLYDEAEEIEDALDEYLEGVMEEMEALQDSDYGESWD
jgi:hypothetical protein